MSREKVIIRLDGFHTLGITEESKGEVHVLSIEVSPFTFINFSEEVKTALRISVKEEQEISKFLTLFGGKEVSI